MREAVSKFSKEIDNKNNSYFETLAISHAEQNNSYYYAIKKDYKIRILFGFQQEKLFQNWLSIGRKKENLLNLIIHILVLLQVEIFCFN